MRIPALADYSRKNIFETVKDIRDATIMVRQLREQKQSACQFPTEHFVETYWTKKCPTVFSFDVINWTFENNPNTLLELFVASLNRRFSYWLAPGNKVAIGFYPFIFEIRAIAIAVTYTGCALCSLRLWKSMRSIQLDWRTCSLSHTGIANISNGWPLNVLIKITQTLDAHCELEWRLADGHSHSYIHTLAHFCPHSLRLHASVCDRGAYVCASVCVSEKVTCNMNEWEVFFARKKYYFCSYIKSIINTNLSIERKYVLLRSPTHFVYVPHHHFYASVSLFCNFVFVFFLSFWLNVQSVYTKKMSEVHRVKQTSLAIEMNSGFNCRNRFDCNWFSYQNVFESAIDI